MTVTVKAAHPGRSPVWRKDMGAESIVLLYHLSVCNKLADYLIGRL